VILLLGGTSETASLAQAMLDEGWRVLVSTATDASLDLPPGVRRRVGRLDGPGLAVLAVAEGARALVDAGHPFAEELHWSALQAAALAGLPLLRFERSSFQSETALIAQDHREAARLAFSLGGPVLLTTGSRHLMPYVAEARRTGLRLAARVLDHPESHGACEAVGLRHEERILGRGPFSLEQNREALRGIGARALVSKDSGEAGGLVAKAEAAHREGAALILVSRPVSQGTYPDMPSLVEALRPILGV